MIDLIEPSGHQLGPDLSHFRAVPDFFQCLRSGIADDQRLAEERTTGRNVAVRPDVQAVEGIGAIGAFGRRQVIVGPRRFFAECAQVVHAAEIHHFLEIGQMYLHQTLISMDCLFQI